MLARSGVEPGRLGIRGYYAQRLYVVDKRAVKRRIFRIKTDSPTLTTKMDSSISVYAAGSIVTLCPRRSSQRTSRLVTASWSLLSK